MNINEAFAILDIAVTKDENAIRDAYHKLLAVNNPEDNPEGFKRLREAYEVACEYARTPDEESGDNQGEYDLSTPMGRWANDIMQIYNSISRRCNIEEWRQLLKSDICYDLDYCEEAKWELFRILARYFRVPNEVYKLLDDTYGIVENEQEFNEHLPVEFVNYMKDCIEQKGFDFQFFEGPDDADYDTFREYLYQMENAVYSGSIENVEDYIKVIESTGIYHPQYTEVLARYYALAGDNEKAIECANKVINDERLAKGEDTEGYIIISAEVLMMAGDKERARDILEEYSKKGRYYVCERCLTKYYLEKDMLNEAILHIDKAMDIASTEEIHEIAQEIDARYIDKYEKEAEEGSLNEEYFSNLMYAYLHMEQPKKALELIAANKEFMDNIDKHYKILISLNLSNEDCPKAMEYAKCYAKKLENELEKGIYEEDETEEDKKRNLVYAYGSMANILVEQGQNEYKQSDKAAEHECYLQAYDKCKIARKYGKDNMQMMSLEADILYLLNEFEKSCDICDEILEINENVFEAVTKKQRGCFRLGRSQEVIDLFYRAKAMYSKRPIIYAYAAREFLKYNQIEDARSILEQAYEEDIKEEYAIRAVDQLVKYSETQDIEEKINIINSLPDYIKEGEKERYDELAAYLSYFYVIEVYEHRAAFKVEDDELIKYINKALDFDDRNPAYLSMAGTLYKSFGKYDEAMEYYKKIKEIYGDSRNVELDFADLYIEQDKSDEAVEAIKKAEELGAEEPYTHRYIAYRYDRLAENIHNAKWCRDSIRHYMKQIEETPDDSNYYYYRIAISYMYLEEYDVAYDMITKAIDASNRKPTDDMMYIKAKILLLKGEYQKSVEIFGMAMNRRATPYADENANRTYDIIKMKTIAYRKMGAYDRAINTAIDAFNGFYTNEDLQDSVGRILINTYIECGRFERARQFLDEHLKRIISDYDYSEYKVRILEEETYKKMGDLRTLYNVSVEEYRKYKNEWASYVAGVTSLILNASDREGVMYLEETLGKTTDSARDKMDWLMDTILILKHLGHEDKANYYIDIFEQIILECYPAEKDYIPISKYVDESFEHLSHLSMAIMYWCIKGHVDVASKYIDILMKTGDEPLRCTWRNDIRKQALAVYYEASGDKEKAMALLKEISDNYESYYAIVRMRRMYGAVFKSSYSNSASKNVNSNANNTSDNAKENNTGKWSLLEQLKKHLKK